MNTTYTILSKQHTKELTRVIERWLRRNSLLQGHHTLEVGLKIQKHPAVVVQCIPHRVTGDELDSFLLKSVNEISLPPRIHNILSCAGIATLGMLVRKTDHQILKYRNFGRKALEILQEKLGEFGLTLGMQIETGPKEREFLLGSSFDFLELSWGLCGALNTQYSTVGAFLEDSNQGRLKFLEGFVQKSDWMMSVAELMNSIESCLRFWRLL